jgi:small multidrug resistance pump
MMEATFASINNTSAHRCAKNTAIEITPRLRMNKWIFLLLAIVFEVTGTSALKACDGFSRFWPSAIVVVGYGLSFYFLSIALRVIPVGVAYAVWGGVGIVLVSLLGWLVFKQRLDGPAMLGIAMILAGIVVLRVFSSTASA